MTQAEYNRDIFLCLGDKTGQRSIYNSYETDQRREQAKALRNN